MIRVGLYALGRSNWLAGHSYIWNLLWAVGTIDKPKIQPVLISSLETPVDPSQFAKTEQLFIAQSVASSSLHLLGRAAARFAGLDPIALSDARKGRLDVLSHGSTVGARFPLPWVYWIPDLQHLRLPGFFSFRERYRRDRAYRAALSQSDLCIVSSQAALADVRQFYGEAAALHCRVLQFVGQPRAATDPTTSSRDALCARYSIPTRYIYLPNQFWKHKNHQVVVDALRLMVSDRPELTIVATGLASDYRHPKHYRQLISNVRNLGLSRRFIHLGVVPFADVIGLMQHASAVLNPSRSEGWSTTVEEAKSLGKRVVLSDIAVHREQAPAGALYFDPADVAALCRLLIKVWDEQEPALDAARARIAAQELPGRTRAFGETYQAIILEAVSRRGRGLRRSKFR